MFKYNMSNDDFDRGVFKIASKVVGNSKKGMITKSGIQLRVAATYL